MRAAEFIRGSVLISAWLLMVGFGGSVAQAWPTDIVPLGYWDSANPYVDSAIGNSYLAINDVTTLVAYSPNLNDMDQVIERVLEYMGPLQAADPTRYRLFAEIPRGFFKRAVGGSTEDWDAIDEFVKAVEPYAYGWFLIDEPDQPTQAWATPEAIEELVEEHIQPFSDKPTLLVFSWFLDLDRKPVTPSPDPVPVGEYLPWVNYVGLDFYSVLWENGNAASRLSEPVEAIQTLKATVADWETANPEEPERIVFFVAQSFGRDPLRLLDVGSTTSAVLEATSNNFRYPTLEEARYSGWMPIINGCHGVFWYSHWYAPGVRDFVVGPVARELAGYDAILRGEDTVLADTHFAFAVPFDATTPTSLTIDDVEVQRRDGTWVEIYDPSTPLEISVAPGEGYEAHWIREDDPDFEPFDFFLSDRSVRFRVSKEATQLSWRVFFHRTEESDVMVPPVFFEFSETWLNIEQSWLGHSTPWSGELGDHEVIVSPQSPSPGLLRKELVDLAGRSLQGPVDYIGLIAAEPVGSQRAPSIDAIEPSDWYSEVNFGIQHMIKPDPNSASIFYLFACNSSPFPLAVPFIVTRDVAAVTSLQCTLEQDQQPQGPEVLVLPGAIEPLIDTIMPYEVQVWRLELVVTPP